MESEKVKAIKEALECCINTKLTCCNDCPYNNNGRLSCLESEMLKDALNLINELESENERLKTQLAQANAGIVNCSGWRLVELNAVREFAEKLWNTIKDKGIDYKIGLRALGEEIDELLKEYEK